MAVLNSKGGAPSEEWGVGPGGSSGRGTGWLHEMTLVLATAWGCVLREGVPTAPDEFLLEGGPTPGVQ